MTSTATEQLQTTGIVALPDAHQPAAVSELNRFVDSRFTSGTVGRSDIGADVLAQHGLLGVAIPPTVRAFVGQLYPDGDAVLYHCHVYEIAAGQQRPHIRSRHLDGWHRDAETIAHARPGEARQISIFTYLFDVGEGDGAFELLPRPPWGRPRDGFPCVSVRGAAGFTFAWNRSWFHRASANTGTTRRRVLKLSLQPRALPNPRLAGAELSRARELSDDPELTSLLGGPVAPLATAVDVVVEPMEANGRMRVGRVDAAAYHLATAGRSALRTGRTALDRSRRPS